MKQVESTTKIQEARFVNARLKGMSQTKAAMIATGTKDKNIAKVRGHRLATSVNVQESIQKSLKQYGITTDILVGVVVQALTAKKTTAIQGEVFETDLPDHTVRLKAVQMLGELMGFKQKPPEVSPGVWQQMQPGAPSLQDNPEVQKALENGNEVEMQRVIFKKEVS